MTDYKIREAIKIFKEQLPEAKGKFRACLSKMPNEVDIFCEDGLYCIVCIKCKAVKVV